MRIPECFETLTADLVMGSCIHKDNDEEHEVASDTTRLVIVDLNCCLWSNFCKLYEQQVVGDVVNNTYESARR